MAVALLTAGCASSPAGRAGTAPRASLNEQLAAVSARGPAAAPTGDYRIGPGDVLEIDVFQADELDRTVRVRPDGTISFPLLGLIRVAGHTTARLESALADRLGRDYLNAPQVSVFVTEYRSHPVSVFGEVNAPGIYYLREPRSLVAMLSESGGLTQEASSVIHLRRKQPGDAGTLLLTIDLDELLQNPSRDLDLALQDDDTIFVPKAGTIFVEGSVRKPGAYALSGPGTVLKAVTMAGGLEFSAKTSSVQVVRAGRANPDVLTVDLGAIRDDPTRDVPIEDGDVVIVGADPVKLGLVGLWRGVAGLVRLSTGF